MISAYYNKILIGLHIAGELRIDRPYQMKVEIIKTASLTKRMS